MQSCSRLLLCSSVLSALAIGLRTIARLNSSVSDLITYFLSLVIMSDQPRKTRDEYELVVLPPLDTAEYHSPQDEALETAPQMLAAEDTIALGRTSIAHALPTPSAGGNGPSVGRFISTEFSALRNVSWSPMDLRGKDEVSQKLLDMYSHVNALGYEGERRGSRELLDLA